jgi:prepilin-type N-terminal cleavage/methylation domain-containing protein
MLSHLRKGFTLMELMIVIAIIGVLAASLFPALTGYLSRARDTKKIAEIKDLNTALIVYQSDSRTYHVPNTGSNGNGQGAVNFTNGTTYTKTLLQ